MVQKTIFREPVLNLFGQTNIYQYNAKCCYMSLLRVCFIIAGTE